MDHDPARHFFHECDGEKLSCSMSTPIGPADASTVVLLHGAGTSDKERFVDLMADFAARGHRVLTFDFSGHGGSSGELRELSLQRRFIQARALIDEQVPPGDSLLLVGFSMSGQTVADLVAHYGPRVSAIGLGAPAVYAQQAWPVRFGSGFTEIIREWDSWRRSAALDTFRTFTARAVLAVPARDSVIPPAVTEAVAEALALRSQFTHLVYKQASHQLGRWFRRNPQDRLRFVDALLDGQGR